MTQLSEFALNLTGQPMFQTSQKIKALESQGKHFIHFELGEPDFPAPDLFIKNSIKLLKQKKHTYYSPAQGIPELREEIAEFHTRINNLPRKLKASEVVIAPGCNPLIYCIFKCILEEGDQVDYPWSIFPTYLLLYKLMKLNPCVNPIPKEEMGDTTAYARHAKSKMRVLVTPSNPYGVALAAKHLKFSNDEVKNNIMQNGFGFTLSDEIYQLITYDGKPAPSMLQADPYLEHTAVISGFSKAFSMTGVRIGYMIGPEWLCEKVTLMLETIVSCTSTLTQRACLGLLPSWPDKQFKKQIAILDRRRNLIFEGLRKIDGLDCYKPNGAFYICPNIKNTGLTDIEFTELMLKYGVGVLPISDFGEHKHDFVRLAYCIPEDQIKEGLKRIEMALHNR